MSRTPKVARVARLIRDEYQLSLTVANVIAQALRAAGSLDEAAAVSSAAPAAEFAKAQGGKLTISQAAMLVKPSAVMLVVDEYPRSVAELESAIATNPAHPAAVMAAKWRANSAVPPHLVFGAIDVHGPAAVPLDGGGVLLTGHTGSGKSYALRSALTRLATEHGPEQVEYLIGGADGHSFGSDIQWLPHVLGVHRDADTDLGFVEHLEAEIQERTRRPRQGVRRPELVVVVDGFVEAWFLGAAHGGRLMAALQKVAQAPRSAGITLVVSMHTPPRPGPKDEPRREALLLSRLAVRIHYGALRPNDPEFSAPDQADRVAGGARIGKQALIRWRAAQQGGAIVREALAEVHLSAFDDSQVSNAAWVASTAERHGAVGAAEAVASSYPPPPLPLDGVAFPPSSTLRIREEIRNQLMVRCITGRAIDPAALPAANMRLLIPPPPVSDTWPGSIGPIRYPLRNLRGGVEVYAINDLDGTMGSVFVNSANANYDRERTAKVFDTSARDASEEQARYNALWRDVREQVRGRR